MEWMQWNSGIWWWGHCLWCKKVITVDALHAVYIRPTTIYHYSTAFTAFTAFTASTAYCIHCVPHHIPLFHCTLHPLHPLPTTIPLHTASTAYCTHCVLCPLHTASTVSTACMAYIGNLFTHTKCPPHPPMLLVTHEIHYKPKISHFQPIPNVPSTNQKSAKNLHFFHCMANLSRLGNSSSHQ